MTGDLPVASVQGSDFGGFEPVEFGAGFTGRVGRLIARLGVLGRAKEGIGLGHRMGAGEEWLGFRPYRPGDDLRRLDPDLLARFDKPYVRLTRREASEHWALWIDGSASMGVGEGRSKLQAAAELSVALCSLAKRRRARVTLEWTGASPRRLDLPARMPLERVLESWSGVRPEGRFGLAERLTEGPGPRAGRWILIGDLEGLTPGDFLTRIRPGTELLVGALFAGEELDPDGREASTWTCPETGDRLSMPANERLAGRYEQAMSRRLEALRLGLGRHRARFAVLDARDPFETHALELASLAGRGTHR